MDPEQPPYSGATGAGLNALALSLRNERCNSRASDTGDSMTRFHEPRDRTAIPIWFVNAANYAGVRERLDAPARAYADAAGLSRAQAVPCCCREWRARRRPVRDRSCRRTQRPVSARPPVAIASAGRVPVCRRSARRAAAGARVCARPYRFTRYRKTEARQVSLVLPHSVDRAELDRIVEGVTLARDLINTPATTWGRPELGGCGPGARARHGAKSARSSGTIC